MDGTSSFIYSRSFNLGLDNEKPDSPFHIHGVFSLQYGHDSAEVLSMMEVYFALVRKEVQSFLNPSMPPLTLPPPAQANYLPFSGAPVSMLWHPSPDSTPSSEVSKGDAS